MFRPLDEGALVALDDDALIAYGRAARAAGHPSVSAALAILVYGHHANIRRRVALKVPAEAVEEVTDDVLVSAIQAAFDGSSVGEFVAWLGTITKRRIADFHRRRPKAVAVPLDEGLAVAAPDESTVAVDDAIERVLGRLSSEHRRVVEQVVFGDLAPADVPGFTAANVHQIMSRFRAALRAELEGPDG